MVASGLAGLLLASTGGASQQTNPSIPEPGEVPAAAALLFRDNSRPWIAGFYAAAVALLAAAGLANGAGPVFFVGVALGAVHLGWQAVTVDTDDAKDCRSKFKSNRDFGLLLFAAFALDRLVLA